MSDYMTVRQWTDPDGVTHEPGEVVTIDEATIAEDYGLFDHLIPQWVVAKIEKPAEPESAPVGRAQRFAAPIVPAEPTPPTQEVTNGES